MKKSVLLMAFLIWASFATAQKTYVGLGLSLPIVFDVGVVALPGFQVGGEIAEHVELRGTLDTVIVANIIGLDVLYTDGIPDTNARWYAGGGMSTLIVAFAQAGGIGFGLRTPIGAEFFITPEQNIGIFAEAQPNIFFGGGFLLTYEQGLIFTSEFLSPSKEGKAKTSEENRKKSSFIRGDEYEKSFTTSLTLLIVCVC